MENHIDTKKLNRSIIPYWQSQDIDTIKLYNGDCLDILKKMSVDSIQCVVTSPPYYGLREYTNYSSEIGAEQTPEEYVKKLVQVFQSIYQVLRKDGTVWLNLGDSYSDDGNIYGIPWRVAFALQKSGWILRQDIIWHKPNAMTESVKNRCTKIHEYIFLLTKQSEYYYDSKSIKVNLSSPIHYPGNKKRNAGKKCQSFDGSSIWQDPKRLWGSDDGKNKRSVWTVTTSNYEGAHFATFPQKLIEPCILAGSRENDIILDPFMGSGTTAITAISHKRKVWGIELNTEYIELQKKRIEKCINGNTHVWEYINRNKINKS